MKSAIVAQPMNDQMHKNKFQMPNLLNLLDSVAKIITLKTAGDVWFTLLDLKFAFSQIKLSEQVISHYNLIIVCGEYMGTYRLKNDIYGLKDMPKKAVDTTTVIDHNQIVKKFSFAYRSRVLPSNCQIEHFLLINNVSKKISFAYRSRVLPSNCQIEHFLLINNVSEKKFPSLIGVGFCPQNVRLSIVT